MTPSREPPKPARSRSSSRRSPLAPSARCRNSRAQPRKPLHDFRPVGDVTPAGSLSSWARDCHLQLSYMLGQGCVVLPVDGEAEGVGVVVVAAWATTKPPPSPAAAKPRLQVGFVERDRIGQD